MDIQRGSIVRLKECETQMTVESLQIQPGAEAQCSNAILAHCVWFNNYKLHREAFAASGLVVLVQ